MALFTALCSYGVFGRVEMRSGLRYGWMDGWMDGWNGRLAGFISMHAWIVWSRLNCGGGRFSFFFRTTVLVWWSSILVMLPRKWTRMGGGGDRFGYHISKSSAEPRVERVRWC